MSYDEKCKDLADYFLEDERHLVVDEERLAQHIQDAIEDWLKAERESNG